MHAAIKWVRNFIGPAVRPEVVQERLRLGKVPCASVAANDLPRGALPRGGVDPYRWRGIPPRRRMPPTRRSPTRKGGADTNLTGARRPILGRALARSPTMRILDGEGRTYLRALNHSIAPSRRSTACVADLR